MTASQDERQRLHRERLARQETGPGAARNWRPLPRAAGAVALVSLLVAVASGCGNSKSSSGPPASPGLLASTSGEASGGTVDGIKCEAMEQVLFHIHAHLAVYVGGRKRLLPEGIGIAPPRTTQPTPQGPFVTGGSCFYWLHSHTRDGVIHIESPVQRVYTLGNYFDIWHQPLGSDQVGPAKGRVTAYLNGRRYHGNPRSIPLKRHALIQLDVGAPVVPPARFTFPPGL